MMISHKRQQKCVDGIGDAIFVVAG
ncbi:hypothetical protein IL54_2733 [Sphingobium sp. ba1]|nr:hypothetical protein IL54_2733 [Sphingobium sp. ba1]